MIKVLNKKYKKKRTKKWYQLDYNEKVWILMLLPGIIFTLVFRYGPMFGIIMAFQDFDPIKGFFGSEWVGLENFQYIFILPGFTRAIKNTIVIAFFKIVLGILVPLILALLINEITRPLFTKFIKTTVFLPFFLSWVILGGMMIQILGLGGLVNTVLEQLHLEPIMFLLDNNWFRPVLISTDVWKGMGYNMIIFLAAITAIDSSQYESAKIDGANRFQQMLYVTIPGMARLLC